MTRRGFHILLALTLVACVLCQLFDQREARFYRDVDKGDFGALFGKRFDQCGADPRTAAGDQDAAVFQVGMDCGWVWQMILPLISRGKLTRMGEKFTGIFAPEALAG